MRENEGGPQWRGEASFLNGQTSDFFSREVKTEKRIVNAPSGGGKDPKKWVRAGGRPFVGYQPERYILLVVPNGMHH